MQFSVKSNVDQVIGELNAAGKRQVPFATALTLTRVAQMGKRVVVAEIGRVFDRPTARTMQALRVIPATKNNLAAEVSIKDEAPKGTPASKYLRAEIEGGGRRDKSSERFMRQFGKLPAGMQWVPGSGVPLDQYGNVKGSYMVRLMSLLKVHNDPYLNTTEQSKKRNARKERPIYFIGRPGGGRLPMGVWQRFRFTFGTAIKPILIFTKPVQYKRRLQFTRIVQGVVDREFTGAFRVALREALATAR